MKLLAIGLDGGDRRIIENMPMPFLHSLLQEDQTPKITGDLISRGWAEIYTGRHAVETGALYTQPNLDGTYNFNDSFNYKKPLKAGIEPLWRTLSARGVSVGFMNVPTTSPAEQVNGFLVGGAGGGLHTLTGVADALCDDAETKAILEANGYISDLRIGAGTVSTASAMFDRLDEIIERRRDAFLALCKKHAVDLGFLCFRASTTVQYVCMSEIEAIIASRESADDELGCSNNEDFYTKIQRRILQHFRNLDAVLQSVFEALQPNSYVFCADHGAAPYKFNANANTFLQESGYQRAVPRSRLKAWKGLFVLQHKLIKGNKRRVVSRPIPFDPAKSIAFGKWYCHGIFINDAERFNGPVPVADLDGHVKQIVEDFNRHPVAKQHGMEAQPFRCRHKESPWYNELPDISIEKPDEMFFLGRGDFVSPNAYYGPVPDDLTGLTDMNAGQKSRHPLFMVSSDLLNLIEDSDPRSIPLVHRVILRAFQ